MAADWLNRKGIGDTKKLDKLQRSLHLRSEIFTRIFLTLLLLGLPAGILAVRWGETAVTIHAAMPEKGGFLPDVITAEAGKPFTLRLISDDMLHGFAIGQSDFPAVEIKPGQVTEVTLAFDEPGTYTYYCTVWCGPNHWRMRGTIEVKEDGEMPLTTPQLPLYMTLGLDIDAPHLANVVPAQMPVADLGTAVPPQFLNRDLYLTQSPAAVWQTLRAAPELADFDDAALWNMVAFIWQSQAADEQRQIGAALYAQNCAACHGRTGQGDGVFGQEFDQAADFTDAQTMLGASTAVLDGKIRRGGMGTGMPYWGTIFTDKEIDALIAYLWTFQFLMGNEQ